MSSRVRKRSSKTPTHDHVMGSWGFENGMNFAIARLSRVSHKMIGVLPYQSFCGSTIAEVARHIVLAGSGHDLLRSNHLRRARRLVPSDSRIYHGCLCPHIHSHRIEDRLTVSMPSVMPTSCRPMRIHCTRGEEEWALSTLCLHLSRLIA